MIVVGVNAYQNDRWDLHYAADDARANGAIVAERLEASGAYEEVHTVWLIAERGASGEITGTATRADVRAVLDVLAGEAGDAERLAAIPGAAELSKTGPDDLVYLAFSGHGLSGENGLFHLFLSDIGEGDSRVVDDALLESTLDSDELARRLRGVDAGEFVMVIDACNAAASVEGGGFKPGPMGSRGLGQLAYDNAMRVLAASQAEAVALERPAQTRTVDLRDVARGFGGRSSGSSADGWSHRFHGNVELRGGAGAVAVRSHPRWQLHGAWARFRAI